MQTLEELRAANAALEDKPAASPQDQPVDPKADAVVEQEEEESGADLDESDDSPKADAEDWMKGDDQESQPGAEKKFTDHDVAAAKKPLRAKVQAKDAEIDELKKQLEAIKSQQHQAPQVGAKPTREQFYDEHDPDEAYNIALGRWTYNAEAVQQQAKQQKLEQDRAQIEQVQAIKASVDQHFVRAEKLIEQSGIAPELYQSADGVVRTALEEVFPNEGDQVTDFLIAQLGEGSERVMYNLGVNKGRLAELTKLLKDDSKGIKAAVFLGKLSAELTAPAKRKSNAPAPAAQIQGDANATVSDSKLLRQYKEAHAKGNAQAAFDLKSKAKAAGINTKTW